MDNCKQLLVATTPTPTSIEGTMSVFFREEAKGKWQEAWAPFPIVIGKNGWKPSSLKWEGDGCSPMGLFPLRQAFGKERNPNIRMPYLCIEGIEGVDDPSSRYYNRLVRREEIADIDWKSAEKMEEYPIEYAWGLVVGYNTEKPQPGAGSCIFLHVWSSPQKGTAGCTAMEASMMEKIIHWLDPDCHP